MTRRLPIPLAWVVAVLLLAGGAVYVVTHLQIETLDRKAGTSNLANAPGAPKVSPGPAELPVEADFQTVGENDRLRLKLDAKTGHFLVEDKKEGRIWRSYPDPAQWQNETTGGLWRTHLRSPVMLQYIDLNGNKLQPKETNMLEEQGTIKDLQTFQGGFRLTFDMPSKEIAIPVEVKLENDSIVTRIVDSGVKEGKLSLLWVRLYPFFAAEQSEGQDGYMFVPDGSGALIAYDSNSTNSNRMFREPVFGEDLAFSDSDKPRQDVIMPVYGAKNENRGFLAILEDGAEFAEVLASPSGVFSTYNWVTTQANYRRSYRQVTNREKNRSFVTYDKSARFHTDRVTRYVLLDSAKSDYVGMAERYRQYLTERYNMNRIKPKAGKVPMDLVIVGADTAPGLLGDRYVKATTTSEAMQIVQRLYGLGIDNMAVRYWGWQEDGFGSFGGLTRVDKRIGGDSGMKQFIDFAHSLDVPVYLSVNYMENNNGSGGFSSRIHGVRDMGGTPIADLVSLKFLDRIVDKDIAYFRKLGTDGIELHAIGRYLNSDFNTKYGSSRDESRRQQQSITTKLRDGLGHVYGFRSNFSVAPFLDGVARLADDYSYDLFTKAGVPFAQIALHGLVPYTGMPSNDRDQFHQNFLHDIEYGANPSYEFVYDASDDLKYVKNIHLYSPSFKEWEQTAVQEYQKWNEALGDVQDQFIIGHRILTDQVRETAYANGKRIVVNYGVAPYQYGDKTVLPEDYIIVREGAKP